MMFRIVFFVYWTPSGSLYTHVVAKNGAGTNPLMKLFLTLSFLQKENAKASSAHFRITVSESFAIQAL